MNLEDGRMALERVPHLSQHQRQQPRGPTLLRGGACQARGEVTSWDLAKKLAIGFSWRTLRRRRLTSGHSALVSEDETVSSKRC